jgi:transposase-like protein
MSKTDYRPRRSRAQWQSLINQAEQSALSIAEFCRIEAISLSSFYQWRKRLAAERGSAEASTARLSTDAFIDLGALSDGAHDASGPWDLELQLGTNVMLRLRRG